MAYVLPNRELLVQEPTNKISRPTMSFTAIFAP